MGIQEKTEMKGYQGKILRVNLTQSRISEESPPEEYYKLYLGGRGFIIHTLLNETPRGVDALSPENKIIFALGPITGHPLMGSGRNSIGAKSPLTGAYGESEAGGFWGAELKRAGYDGIIVEGKAERPVYLWVKDGQAEIRDASRLWETEVADTEKAIQKELGNSAVRTAVIGPAGEKLVRFACIFNDISHAAGRTGLGAVMGSKKLKAIAVRGTKAPEMADRQKILEMSRWMARNYRAKCRFWEYGTGSIMDYYESVGNLPIKNFTGGRFPTVEKIMPQAMFKKSCVVKMDNCFGCPVRCKKRIRLEKPYPVDPIYGGPEYETLGALGSNCGIDDAEAVIKANELCGRYGIDTISAGVAISFAMECFEKGILTNKDTDGLDLSFGNVPAMLEMAERIALRKGLGDLLAEGVKRAAERIGRGSEKFAMHVKGEELPMHDPRYKQAMGLHYCVHATGADHCTGVHDDLINRYTPDWEKIGLAESIPVSEMSPRKARMLYQVGLGRQLANSLGICFFLPWNDRQLKEALESITGWPMSSWKLMKAVERGITLSRVFNLREGFSEKDDVLPERFVSSPPDSPLKGIGVDPEKLAVARRAYYQMMGWDESGVPTYGRLVELNIEWAAKYLQK
jgi:aldehyde:ferredoxin oxidoreductase